MNSVQQPRLINLQDRYIVLCPRAGDAIHPVRGHDCNFRWSQFRWSQLTPRSIPRSGSQLRGQCAHSGEFTSQGRRERSNGHVLDLNEHVQNLSTTFDQCFHRPPQEATRPRPRTSVHRQYSRSCPLRGFADSRVSLEKPGATLDHHVYSHVTSVMVRLV
jgi:hypothetical protein